MSTSTLRLLGRAFSAGCLAASLAGCAAAKPAPTAPATPPARLYPDELPFLSDLRQLTFGGENAEAYWSFDGKQLSFQARGVNEGCDRIYRMPVDAPVPVQISSGKGPPPARTSFPRVICCTRRRSWRALPARAAPT